MDAGFEQIVLGRRYRIETSGCCLTLSFSAVLTEKDDDHLSFDNGVVITGQMRTAMGEPGRELVPVTVQT